MPRFEVVMVVAAPPGPVFETSLDVDVHTASMAESDERVVGEVSADPMTLGQSVTWRARHFGVQWRVTSTISAYDPPTYFVDEQLKGPFKRWHHAHHFESDGHGGTVMRDVIDYAAPFGPVGKIAEMLVLDRYMRRLIGIRNQHIKETWRQPRSRSSDLRPRPRRADSGSVAAMIVEPALVTSHYRHEDQVQRSLPDLPDVRHHPEFLPHHRQHRQQIIQIISAAEPGGQTRLAEMNQQVLTNLDHVITGLQTDADP